MMSRVKNGHNSEGTFVKFDYGGKVLNSHISDSEKGKKTITL